MEALSDRYGGLCYVCEQEGDDLVWDEDAMGHRHEGCTLSSVAAHLPVVIRDLEIGIQTAEQELLGDPFTRQPYRQAWVGLRTVARQALEDLQRLEIPPARPLEQILGEIIAEGHDVTLQWRPWLQEGQRWECATKLNVDRIEGEDWSDRQIRSHHGEVGGTSALEAAENRLRDIRAGKGLAVLVSWFLPVVDVEIREAPVGTEHDAEACADRSGLGDDDALPDQIEAE